MGDHRHARTRCSVPPYAERNIGIRTAWRIHEMAWACCAALSEAFNRTWMSAEFAVGNR